MPSGWNTATWFSPGICPQGYTIAQSTTEVNGAATETEAKCCPRGYSLTSTFGCVSSVPFGTYNVTAQFSGSAVQLLTVNNQGFADAYGSSVSIRWQAKDFATPTTTSSISASKTSSPISSPISSPTTTVPLASSTSSQAPITDIPPSHNSSISSSARAGIGLGIAVLVIALCAFGYFWVRRNVRAKTTPKIPEKAEPEDEIVPELQAGGPYRHAISELEETRGVHQLHSGGAYKNAVAEMEEVRGVHQLDAGQIPVELPAEVIRR